MTAIGDLCPDCGAQMTTVPYHEGVRWNGTEFEKVTGDFSFDICEKCYPDSIAIQLFGNQEGIYDDD